MWLTSPSSSSTQKPRRRTWPGLAIGIFSWALAALAQAADPLPDIKQFATHPTSRFLIDWSHVRTGHPYKGRRAQQPHTGAHVYFQPPKKRPDPRVPSSYPAIYAIADGHVARIDESFKQREMFSRVLNKRLSNYRYGVTLAIGLKDGKPVHFHYSIEPMVDPGERDFYKPFILVKRGQQVRRGQIIAYMYLPPHPQLQSFAHIHFNLMDTGKREFMAPTIFTPEINRQFHATWDKRGLDGNQPIAACMGFRLTARENPFGTGNQDLQ